MSKLIESIIINDLVSAQQLFESKMDEVAQRKLYERKRSIAVEINEAVGVEPDPEGRVRGGQTRPKDDGNEPYISRRTREKVQQLQKSKSGFRGLAADVLGSSSERAKSAVKKFIKKKVTGKKTPRDPSAIAPGKQQPKGLISRTLDRQASNLAAKEAGERATKTAWERSAGGKIAKVTKPVAKGIGQVIAGMMQGAE